jgi:hypothetical protein
MSQWLPQSTRGSDPLNAPEPVSNAQKLQLAQCLRNLLGLNDLDRVTEGAQGTGYRLVGVSLPALAVTGLPLGACERPVDSLQ